MNDCDLLQALVENGGTMPWSDLLNVSGDANTANGYLQALIESGYVSGSLQPLTSVRITPSGRKKLHELVSIKKKEAEREERIAIDRKRAHIEFCVTVIVAIVGAIITVAGFVRSLIQ